MMRASFLRFSRFLLLAAALVALTAYFTHDTRPAQAQETAAGDLDIGFDGDGKVITRIGSGDDWARRVVIQSDGKIVAAGYSHNGANNDFALARYNVDGSLDLSFDSDGKVTTPILSGEDRIWALALQSDGKIVAAGRSHNGSNHDFALARYNANGSLDTTFDGDGKVTTAIGSGEDRIYGIAIQPDGKIVVGGYSHNGTNDDFALARYNANGSLDTTFGTDGADAGSDPDGYVITDFASNLDQAFEIALQSDGKIVAVGRIVKSSYYLIGLARYNANGTLDTSFGTGGKVATDLRGELWDLALQSDGKILVAGDRWLARPLGGFGAKSTMRRYNANGSLDTTFGNGGYVTSANPATAYAMAVQDDGKIVLAGTTGDLFVLARYDANGSWDTNFGTDGIVTTIMTNSRAAIIYDLAIQSDGKIVAVGHSRIGASLTSNLGFALARYLPGEPPEPPGPPPLPSLTVCWDSGASGAFDQCAPAVAEPNGHQFKAHVPDSATHARVAVTPSEEQPGATVKMGKVTYSVQDGRSVKSVDLRAVASGEQSAAIELDRGVNTHTPVDVEVTESGSDTGKTYNLFITKRWPSGNPHGTSPSGPPSTPGTAATTDPPVYDADLTVCSEASPSGAFVDDCVPARLDRLGWRVLVSDSTTHVKVTPNQGQGATVRMGKVTWDNQGRRTATLSAVANRQQSAAIELGSGVSAIIDVKVTRSGASKTSKLIISKSAPTTQQQPTTPACRSSTTLTHQHEITQAGGSNPVREHTHEKRDRHGQCRFQVIVGNKVIDSLHHTHPDRGIGGQSAPATQRPTAVTLALDPATVSEAAGQVTVTATLDAPAPAGGITLGLYPSPGNTATRDADYTIPDSIAIAAGQRSGTATITVIDDGVAEADETVTVTAFAALLDIDLMGSAVLTITDSCANCGTEGEVGVIQRPPENKYADLITKIKGWRDDPCCASNKAHTDRWDRALLAFGETVADTSLTTMTAAEAQTYADRGWTRWVEVVAALKELEAAGQQAPPNNAPTVSAALADATIVNESGTKEVSLSGVFSDADNDALIVTAGSSDTAVATVSVAVDQSSLTVTAYSRGSATITVTASDGNGGTVSDEFTVSVKAAPVVASSISDVSSLEAGATQDVSLSGVFSDADGDALTVTAVSSDETKATATVVADQSKLTVAGAAQGTATITVTAQDADANRVSDAFDVSVAAPQQQDPANQAPTVSSAIGDATIVNESGTYQVSLSGVFSDADNDSLTVTAASSAETVATVSVAADQSGLTVTAKARGSATITVTANDGNGGTVSDTFTVKVKAAPVVASAISNVAGLEVFDAREISLSGVFSDADGDSLTLSAASSDTTVVESTLYAEALTIFSLSEGTATITVTAEDADGNTVSDTFDVTVVGPPSVVANLRCLAETERVAFLWEEPEWSGGDVYVYDYELTLPDGRSEGGRLKDITLLLRPGTYQAGNEASVSVTTVYELADGSNVSSVAETLTCTVK